MNCFSFKWIASHLENPLSQECGIHLLEQTVCTSQSIQSSHFECPKFAHTDIWMLGGGYTVLLQEFKQMSPEMKTKGHFLDYAQQPVFPINHHVPQHQQGEPHTPLCYAELGLLLQMYRASYSIAYHAPKGKSQLPRRAFTLTTVSTAQRGLCCLETLRILRLQRWLDSAALSMHAVHKDRPAKPLPPTRAISVVGQGVSANTVRTKLNSSLCLFPIGCLPIKIQLGNLQQ